jgi:Zn-finger nucleic acid-binding protein
MDCPNCHVAMQSMDFDRRLTGEVSVDLCFPCHVIWFDGLESVQLAPDGVLELFKVMHKRDQGERNPLQLPMGCPRCGSLLRKTEDLSKGGRFGYFRCVRNDGRLTPFFDFLREKQFVRDLTPGEIARVRADVREVRCSGCGAPIDLGKDTCCPHCGAPISILDADAVEKAVRMYSTAAARRANPDPTTVAAALAQLRASERTLSRQDRVAGATLLGGLVTGGDLIDVCIHAIGGLFD